MRFPRDKVRSTIQGTLVRPYRRGQVTSIEATVEASTRFMMVRPAVFEVVREMGPLTHDELIAFYRVGVVENRWPMALDSSIRSRCHELVVAGLVEHYPTDGRSRFGRRSRQWQAKETGNERRINSSSSQSL